MAKLAIIALLTFALIAVVKLCLRKTLNIEKEKKEFFSYNHINKLHRKIDWSLRISSIITNLNFLYLVLFQSFSIELWVFALVIFVVLDYGIKAFFEWKYSQNPKQSILTISEMFLLLIFIVIVFQLDLLGILA
ncbi:DUF4181 domain-containing protein [Cytobacillus oceanisediminis]|uniref:DUF4181 domain-containing protein n=1 Tax=Cytobacillus oceanisediminis TaxID=665099 RepID=UPI002041A942|nr:DUF4181 domain-containing protein [Cytobacillus oceanisediminis]MCM3393238.1 DUF4181 domain-containing protein [Cytobacillus oceanisediminis]